MDNSLIDFNDDDDDGDRGQDASDGGGVQPLVPVEVRTKKGTIPPVGVKAFSYPRLTGSGGSRGATKQGRPSKKRQSQIAALMKPFAENICKLLSFVPVR